MTRLAITGMDARDSSKGASRETPKEALVRDWARRKLGRIDHELRVARLARHLFELTHRWHGLGHAERRLLVLGSLVHDVGRAIEDKGHARHGARMILDSMGLPVNETERRRIAYLTRYHRGRVPEMGDEEILQHDESDTREDVANLRVLLGLLRASDALDSRSAEAPRLILTLRDRNLSIRGYVEGDAQSAAELFGGPKKFRLLEETLNCEVRTEWFSTEVVTLVA